MLGRSSQKQFRLSSSCHTCGHPFKRNINFIVRLRGKWPEGRRLWLWRSIDSCEMIISSTQMTRKCQVCRLYRLRQKVKLKRHVEIMKRSFSICYIFNLNRHESQLIDIIAGTNETFSFSVYFHRGRRFLLKRGWVYKYFFVRKQLNRLFVCWTTTVCWKIPMTSKDDGKFLWDRVLECFLKFHRQICTKCCRFSRQLWFIAGRLPMADVMKLQFKEEKVKRFSSPVLKMF